MAGGAARVVGCAEHAPQQDLTVEEKQPLTRADWTFIAAVAIGVIFLLVALVQWESGRECVRWSTRIDIDDLGNVRRTRVCAERQPRQPGEEPPFDLRERKGD